MQRQSYVMLVTGLVVLGVAAFGVLSADAANPPSFTAVVNPLDAVPAGGMLHAVACPSAHHCVAVGEVDRWEPLVVAGDPATWSMAQAKQITPTGVGMYPGGTLYSIACRSTTSCVAVGSDENIQPLLLVGNPSTWGAAQAKEITLGAAFDNQGFLLSVRCFSFGSCVATGVDGNSQPFVLTGDPSAWGAAQVREIKLPDSFGFAFGADRNYLGPVSCTSPTWCVSVGTDVNQQPIVAVGNPSTWSAAQVREIPLGGSFGVPGGNYLGSVTCFSSTSCVAVGEDANQKPLVITGDPSTWGAAQVQEIGGYDGGFDSLACPSSTSCVAVGQNRVGQALMLVGDPSTWSSAQARTFQLGASVGSGGALSNIACTSAAACVVVGRDRNGQPLQLAGDPSTWGAAEAKELTLNGPAFGTLIFPAHLNCRSASSCFQLGGYSTPAKNGSYLLHGSPANWNEAGTKLLTYGFGAADLLTAMDCTSSTYCVAVGNTYDGAQLLVLAGNPSTWDAVQTSGNPTTTREVPQVRRISLGTAFGGAAFLSSISCTSRTYCVAVGRDAILHGVKPGQPFVLAGNPSTWTVADAREITMGAARHSTGSLDSVACASRTQCVAVGHDGYYYNQVEPLVLAGNPATWGAAQAKQITLAKYGTLSSVACPSRTYCVSVGESGANGNPLVLAGDPLKWNAHSPFHLRVPRATAATVKGFALKGSTFPGFLNPVSCRSTMYCVAVGGDTHGAPLYITGNPAYWKGRLLARPARSGASFVEAEVATSACTPTACFAGGVSNGGDFVATLK